MNEINPKSDFPKTVGPDRQFQNTYQTECPGELSEVEPTETKVVFFYAMFVYYTFTTSLVKQLIFLAQFN
jgi:hypothetical protein